MVTFIGFLISALIGCIIGYRIRGDEIKQARKWQERQPSLIQGNEQCQHQWTCWGMWGWDKERRYCTKCHGIQERSVDTTQGN